MINNRVSFSDFEIYYLSYLQNVSRCKIKITPIVSNSKDKVFSYKHKFPIQLNKYNLNVSKERNRNKRKMCVSMLK